MTQGRHSFLWPKATRFNESQVPSMAGTSGQIKCPWINQWEHQIILQKITHTHKHRHTYAHTHLHGAVVRLWYKQGEGATGHRFEPRSWRGYSDILWISLLDWITDPERVSSTDQLRLNLISHWGESTECGITKLGVRSGSQLLTRAIN